MFEIAANKFESYCSANFKENANNRLYNFLSDKILIINNDSDNEALYLINDGYYFTNKIPIIFTH
jgi:hypothetical protein